MTTATRTVTVWTCHTCGAHPSDATAIDHSVECQSRVTWDEVEVPRFAVGDLVAVHHAKSKHRKPGLVVQATATWVTIEVHIYDDLKVTTRRRQDDADVKRVSALDN